MPIRAWTGSLWWWCQECKRQWEDFPPALGPIVVHGAPRFAVSPPRFEPLSDSFGPAAISYIAINTRHLNESNLALRRLARVGGKRFSAIVTTAERFADVSSYNSRRQQQRRVLRACNQHLIEHTACDYSTTENHPVRCPSHEAPTARS